ncbi:unnamed protein product [Gadus morhua 'NCC']
MAREAVEEEESTATATAIRRNIPIHLLSPRPPESPAPWKHSRSTVLAKGCQALGGMRVGLQLSLVVDTGDWETVLSAVGVMAIS